MSNSNHEQEIQSWKKARGGGVGLLIVGIIIIAVSMHFDGYTTDWGLFKVSHSLLFYIIFGFILAIGGLLLIILSAYQTIKERTTASVEQQQDQNKLAEYYSKAIAGDAEAQFSLGCRYHDADGVTRDYSVAYQWWGKAAGQGHMIAQYNLGVMNENGESVPKSDEEAFKWYSISAEQNYPSALNKVGVFYRDGRVVPQSDEEAFWRFESAAKKGNQFAQYNLGLAYLDGKGCSANRERAINFLSRAAEKNHILAIRKLDELLGGKSGF